MTRNPPPDLLPRARQILLPFAATVADRDTLLTDAFYLRTPHLYGIEREGSPKVFITRCLKTLLDYGCLAAGEHSLARLLLTARYDCGVDKHAEIDELSDLANALCQSETRKNTVPFAPVDGPAWLQTPAQLQTIDTPRDERRPTIFISYHHGDEGFANRLIADLRAAGHACWIDTSEIKGGDEWVMTIAEGNINSYALAPIITLNALRSKWVRKEILWAQHRKKLILPVILEDVMDESGFFAPVDCQGVKLFDSDYDAMLSRLLNSLPPYKTAKPQSRC